MPPTDKTERMAPQLGLGTVQFGLDYGVANTIGKPSDATVAEILDDALNAEIGIIDTAPAYGDAEARLGGLLPDSNACRIVTKSAVQPHLTSFERVHAELVRATFLSSLQRLRRDSLHGLLVHHATDVLLPGGERLIETLATLRDTGLVRKIGVSIYTADELDGVLDVFIPDIVQLPLSIADQRLLRSGHLAKLKSLGVEIHVRSIFLQGMLLAEPDTLPDFMQPIARRFARVRVASSDAGPLETCLAFVRHVQEVDYVIAGATTSDEWLGIRLAFERCKGLEMNFADLAIEDHNILQPSNWPKRNRT